MLTKRIKVICCYYGDLPATFAMWLETCRRNAAFHFLIVTDQTINTDAPNVEVLHIGFPELREKIRGCIPYEISLENPRRLCEFRPAYGIIFQDYLEDYDFWGHTDMDMLYGDMEHFITDEILDAYPKVLYLGHLGLYRNLPEYNLIPIQQDPLIDWAEIYRENRFFSVDENNGIYRIYRSRGIPVYEERIFLDVFPYQSFMKIDNVINIQMNKPIDKNYLKQLYVWEDGKAYRYFWHRGRLSREEGLYIHCGRGRIKTFEQSASDDDMVIISKHGMTAMKKKEIEIQDFAKYNAFSLKEFLGEMDLLWLRREGSMVKNWLKWRLLFWRKKSGS